MHIHHIAIWTKNLEIEKEFFLKYFDCRSGEKYINEKKQFSSYFIYFDDGCRIELMHQPNIGQCKDNLYLGLTHLAIQMASKTLVEQLTKRLENDGYRVESQPRVTGDGYYESVILDPENNRIELLAMP